MWEIHCLALNGFDLNTGHKLSSKEKKILAARIQTRGSWVDSKNSSSVVRSTPKFLLIQLWPKQGWKMIFSISFLQHSDHFFNLVLMTDCEAGDKKLKMQKKEVRLVFWAIFRQIEVERSSSTWLNSSPVFLAPSRRQRVDDASCPELSEILLAFGWQRDLP